MAPIATRAQSASRTRRAAVGVLIFGVAASLCHRSRAFTSAAMRVGGVRDAIVGENCATGRGRCRRVAGVPYLRSGEVAEAAMASVLRGVFS
jgi:hypothetical protein